MIELLVVVAIVAILAGLLIPTVARARQKAQGIQCLNHHRQLTLAWMNYSLDHLDRFPAASGTIGDTNGAVPPWVDGSLDLNRTILRTGTSPGISRQPICGPTAGDLRPF